MRVTLIHNPQAGDDDNPVMDELVTLIRAAGHSVTLQSSRGDQLEKAIEDPGDLLAVAGGDGTVGAVASRLIGRRIPIAVLPLGTANNISNTLGLTSRPVEELIAGWATARRIRFDVGLVRGPWGTARFIEGLGAGLFANAISQLDAREDVTFGRQDNRDEKTASALRWLKERVWDWPPRELELTLDGEDLSGEYILLQVMNIQHIGPSLHLAPDAEPGDGLPRRRPRQCRRTRKAGRVPFQPIGRPFAPATLDRPQGQAASSCSGKRSTCTSTTSSGRPRSEARPSHERSWM